MNNKIVEDVVKIQDKKPLSDEGEKLRDALRKYAESADVNDGYSRDDFLMMLSYMLLRDTIENLTNHKKTNIIH